MKGKDKKHFIERDRFINRRNKLLNSDQELLIKALITDIADCRLRFDMLKQGSETMGSGFDALKKKVDKVLK